RDENGRSVLVTGEPGVGKTRLVQEVTRRRVEAGELVLAGACSQDQATPYGPLTAALAAPVERGGGDLVAAIGPRGAELAELLPGLRVGAPPVEPSESGADADGFRIIESVRAWLTHLAREGPVLLVVDDLQWADSSTLGVLRDLVIRRPITGLTVVATQRDTEPTEALPVGSFLADLARVDAVARVALEGMTAPELADLVLAMAGGGVGEGLDRVVELLADRTGGNPLYSVQILRHLVDADVVVLQDGVWTVDDAPAMAAVPAGIRAVIDDRVGRLGPGVRELLDVAAVAGLDFDLGAVARAAERSKSRPATAATSSSSRTPGP
ncbi:MAG: AAA family ATPase, partial [Actinomycetota bacterium]